MFDNHNFSSNLFLTCKILPNKDICEAEVRKSLLNFADCLVSNGRECGYAIPFIGGYLCGNPEWEEIVKNTQRKFAEKKVWGVL